mmetsp:Transcript_52615/g.97007  ORF Transcript_52615/g.97007 Transcript_52615/m.97007 type:complete len:202 (+) Transcript_52615:175-780(+)
MLSMVSGLKDLLSQWPCTYTWPAPGAVLSVASKQSGLPNASGRSEKVAASLASRRASPTVNTLRKSGASWSACLVRVVVVSQRPWSYTKTLSGQNMSICGGTFQMKRMLAPCTLRSSAVQQHWRRQPQNLPTLRPRLLVLSAGSQRSWWTCACLDIHAPLNSTPTFRRLWFKTDFSRMLYGCMTRWSKTTPLQTAACASVS